MSKEECIATLEEENRKLRKDNQRLLQVIDQMKMTLNRMIRRYISEE